MRIATTQPFADKLLHLPLRLSKIVRSYVRRARSAASYRPILWTRVIKPRFISGPLDWPLWCYKFCLAAGLLWLLPSTVMANHHWPPAANAEPRNSQTQRQPVSPEPDEHSATYSAPYSVQTGQWHLRVAMGAGYRSNPLLGGKNLPLWLMPDVSYYGEKWFFDNGRVGYTAWQTSRNNTNWSISPVLQINEEKGYFIRSSASNWWQLRNVTYANIGHTEINNGMVGPSRTKAAPSKVSISDVTSRPTALDAGVQLNVQQHDFFAVAALWHDVSGGYQGAHAQLQLGHQWQHSSGVWSVSGGLRYKSRDLIQRYYGISDADAERAGISAWQTTHSWQPQWQLQWQYPLTADWQLHAMWQQQRLDDAVTASPLVENASIHRWFVGASYRFW